MSVLRKQFCTAWVSQPYHRHKSFDFVGHIAEEAVEILDLIDAAVQLPLVSQLELFDDLSDLLRDEDAVSGVERCEGRVAEEALVRGVRQYSLDLRPVSPDHLDRHQTEDLQRGSIACHSAGFAVASFPKYQTADPQQQRKVHHFVLGFGPVEERKDRWDLDHLADRRFVDVDHRVQRLRVELQVHGEDVADVPLAHEYHSSNHCYSHRWIAARC